MHDIALSFDNGPDPSTTPQVLDILAAREIPALFCVQGIDERLHETQRPPSVLRSKISSVNCSTAGKKAC